jgi:hypothetical protein
MVSSFVIAAALATSLPVHVQTCTVSQPSIVPQTGELAGFDSIGGYQLHVRFTNVGTTPIKKISFALNNGTTVTDTGTFSPGVPIDHVIRIDADDATACDVKSLVLADGMQLGGYTASVNNP